MSTVRLFVVICALSCSFACPAKPNENNLEEQFIQLLLDTKDPDVLLYRPDEPFTLKSGRKSPIFVNLGNITSGSAITTLGDLYAQTVENSGLEFDVIFGSAYKGIPLAVTISRSLLGNYSKDYPYGYNRKEMKDHGEGGVLVGANLAGKRVLIIDDVITSGRATIESIDLIEKAGGIPVGLVVSVDRREKVKPLPGNIPVIGITTLKKLQRAVEDRENL